MASAVGKHIASTRAISKQQPLKRIAIQGGSFDPPTHAHVQTAAKIVELFGRASSNQPPTISATPNDLQQPLIIDEVWTVPCGYRQDKPKGTKPEHRLMMLQLAFKDSLAALELPVRIDTVEIENGSAIPTYNLLKGFEQKWPQYEFWFVIGTDLVKDLHKWQHGKEMIEETKFIIFGRNGYDGFNESHPNWPRTFVQAQIDEALRDASSTEVRQRVTAGQPILDLVTPSVAEYIKVQGLYGAPNPGTVRHFKL